ncbi:hypothetical protein [Paenibacillus pinistramenti]|uniref:hypothetical protein n=1 Tax=Paenibacillus pinistramenti TaxID=1768003 RepID=UPI001108193F|nr:hypothetical protein [Paenibacillus pinistramenti]
MNRPVYVPRASRLSIREHLHSSRSLFPILKITSAALLGGMLITVLSGCEPLAASEATLKMQAISEAENKASGLQVIQDVYDKSVEADVYSSAFVNQP